MGVGALGSDNIENLCFELDGELFYVETAAEGWEIGEMPGDYVEQTAQIWSF